MRCVLLICLLLCLPQPVQADGQGRLLWVGDDADQTLQQFQAEGYQVMRTTCAPVTKSCLKDEVKNYGTEGAFTLVARSVYSSLVHDLYADGLTSDQIHHVIMLRAEPAPLHAAYQAQADAPPLVALVEKEDPQTIIYASFRGVKQWRESGVPVNLLYLGPGGLDNTNMHRMTFDIIQTVMGHSPFNEQFQTLLQAYGVWQTPPFQHDDFFEQTAFVSEKPMTKLLQTLVGFHYEKEPYYLSQWKFETYTSFDLMAYRDAVAPGARYVTLRNHRDQKVFLDLDVYGQYEPEIVIGIDDETNLYRMTWFYRTKKMYSWKPDVQNTSARFMGPILLFKELLPADIAPPFLLRSALTLDGITFSEDDPLVGIKSYPPAIQTIITSQNRCINCHTFDGFDAYYFHTDALTGEPQGGFALPFVEYPEEVIEAFLYDQETSAAAIGMTPNPMPKEMADQFFAWWKALPREETDN